jgi:hypothetical protein
MRFWMKNPEEGETLFGMKEGAARALKKKMIQGPVQASAIGRGSRTEALILREIIISTIRVWTPAFVVEPIIISTMSHGIGIAGQVPFIILTILLLGIVPRSF